MPSLRPFKAITYNTKRFKDLSRVVSPPYDIISKKMQDELYRRSPYNIVRLTLGKSKETDGVRDNRYSRAKRFFDSWVKENILTLDRMPALYIYSQKYIHGNKEIERIGFVGLMKLNMDNKRTSLPHENTLLLPKLDRLSLMRAVRVNLEPVFLLYKDESHKILKLLEEFCLNNAPFIDIDFEKVKHRVWRLKNRRIIRKVKDAIASKDIFIADGHHRYEASHTYAIEIEKKNIPRNLKRNSKFIMAYFTEFNDDTITILPSHRLIKDIGILKKDDINPKLEPFFDIEETPNLDTLIAKLSILKRRTAFGIYLGKGELYLLTLKSRQIIDKLINIGSKDWKHLDVTVLHFFLIEYVLRIRDDDDNVEFVKDINDVIHSVDKGKYNLAFILNPTKVHEVERIAKLGERMPRKATYFYPKPLSGIVINKLY